MLARLSRLGLVAGVALTTLVASSGAAHASSWTYRWSATVWQESMMLSKDGNLRSGAVTQWDHSTYDEVIFIHDYESDGYGVRVTWRGDGRSGVCYNTSGDGTTKTCDISIPDGQTYWWQVCAKDGSTILACAPEEPTRA